MTRGQITGLSIQAHILPDVNEHDGSMQVVICFSGNTWAYKRAICSLGYVWGRVSGRLCWSKTAALDDLENEIKKTAFIADSVIQLDQLCMSHEYEQAVKKQAEWKKKYASDNEE